MILEEFSNFCDDEVLATAAGTETFEGKSLDLGGATPGDIGVGEPLYFVVMASNDIQSATGTCTLVINLVSDDQSTIVPADAKLHLSLFVDVTTTSSNAGDVLLCAQLPQEGEAYKEFLGVTVKPTGQALKTAGSYENKINAFLTKAPVKVTAYADGAPTLS